MLSAQSGHNRHGAANGTATAPAAVVKATVDKQKILIGQPIQLMLEVTVPNSPTATGPSLIWPDLDSLPHFEWVEKGKVDSVVRSDGRYYRQYLTVTSFDSGAWSIPRLPFTAGNKKYYSDSVRIEIGYTRTDPSKDYHDIKDIIDVPNPYAKWIPWVVAVVVVGSLVLVIWLIRKRKILRSLIAKIIPAARLSPYEEAVQHLKQLEEGHLPENDRMKEFYTALSGTFRVYLSRRLGVFSLAETSEELIGQLRRMPVAAGSFTEIAETLRMSDFVKFAKYQPGVADSNHHLTVIRSLIGAMEKTVREQEETAAGSDQVDKKK
jgi:hypothetical protein